MPFGRSHFLSKTSCFFFFFLFIIAMGFPQSWHSNPICCFSLWFAALSGFNMCQWRQVNLFGSLSQLSSLLHSLLCIVLFFSIFSVVSRFAVRSLSIPRGLLFSSSANCCVPGILIPGSEETVFYHWSLLCHFSVLYFLLVILN